MSDPIERFRRYLADERDAARLYRALAELADGERRDALLELAAIEDRHAQHWERMLVEHGAVVPDEEPDEPADLGRILARARALGLDGVLGELEQAEREAQGTYDDEPFAAPGMADDERVHERRLHGLRREPSGPVGSPAAGRPAGGPAPTPDGQVRPARIDGDRLREQLAKAEPWHRADKSGSLRAAIFGVSDGLVSNAALIMGFAGSGVANATVAFAGVAGLLAGAFSMAAGEYVSVAGQRDVFEREIRLERAELEERPQEEARELELLYRAKGMDAALARQVAARILQDPDIALDTLAREELGLDPDDLGSPVRVALSSFGAFALGALVPLLPFALIPGAAAAVVAIVATSLVLLGVGAVVGRLSGAGTLRSALRQFAVGAAAAAVTYGVGTLIGGSVAVG